MGGRTAGLKAAALIDGHVHHYRTVAHFLEHVAGHQLGRRGAGYQYCTDDQISEMPLGLQAKILRVLQERVITPLGGSREINVDVRVIETTNRDMMEEIRGGKFREDLYYRLNVFPIATLALSERVEDIIPIAMALLRKHGENEPLNFILSDQAANKLKEHSWPGNVRELDNVIQRALVLNDGPVIEENSIFLQDLRGAELAISTEEFLFSKVS